MERYRDVFSPQKSSVVCQGNPSPLRSSRADLTVLEHGLLQDLPDTGSVRPEQLCYSAFCQELVQSKVAMESAVPENLDIHGQGRIYAIIRRKDSF